MSKTGQEEQELQRVRRQKKASRREWQRVKAGVPMSEVQRALTPVDVRRVGSRSTYYVTRSLSHATEFLHILKTELRIFDDLRDHVISGDCTIEEWAEKYHVKGTWIERVGAQTANEIRSIPDARKRKRAKRDLVLAAPWPARNVSEAALVFAYSIKEELTDAYAMNIGQFKAAMRVGLRQALNSFIADAVRRKMLVKFPGGVSTREALRLAAYYVVRGMRPDEAALAIKLYKEPSQLFRIVRATLQALDLRMRPPGRQPRQAEKCV